MNQLTGPELDLLEGRRLLLVFDFVWKKRRKKKLYSACGIFSDFLLFYNPKKATDLNSIDHGREDTIKHTKAAYLNVE